MILLRIIIIIINTIILLCLGRIIGREPGKAEKAIRVQYKSYPIAAEREERLGGSILDCHTG